VVVTFDAPAGSDKILKYCQLDAAETLADHCRGADRAVVFDEQKALFGLLFEPRHIAFGRAHIGKRRQLLCNIGFAGEPLAVGGGDLLAAPFEQLRQCCLAQFTADGADQIDGKLRMSIGKERCCAPRQRPDPPRAASTMRAIGIYDEVLGEEPLQTLPHGLHADAEAPG
jgi:hypothetical protein